MHTGTLLPTDEMLSDAVLTHAGPCMAQLEAADAAAVLSMAHDQACEWGGVPDEMLAGTMSRRVDHAIHIHICTYTYTYTYAYIYRYDASPRRSCHTHAHTLTHTHMYIYIHI